MQLEGASYRDKSTTLTAQWRDSDDDTVHWSLLSRCRTVQSGLLGQGTFGIVVKALDLRTNPPLEVAIKLLPRGDIVSLAACLTEAHPCCAKFA